MSSPWPGPAFCDCDRERAEVTEPEALTLAQRPFRGADAHDMIPSPPPVPSFHYCTSCPTAHDPTLAHGEGIEAPRRIDADSIERAWALSNPHPAVGREMRAGPRLSLHQVFGDFHDPYAHALVSALDSVRILRLSHEMCRRHLRIHTVGLVAFERGRGVLSRIKHNLARAQQRAAHLSTPSVKRAHSEDGSDNAIVPARPLKMLKY
ncbi:hypothetical protein MVEN_00122100 [Mycena venus]|uniref:Uncharacterized protein n=1 Tax=Mycena venus TaxID=2733690 RepID=A0A8H6Z5A3_9AGAR|nr:hypothetical protein MVEN_00122100 [Mycena venus]